ncbi:T9SS C-terminal target domain-containing protein [Hymenobacter oligotrophus]|uniref:T9SS C-terminal target domain-containing protein n=1 Tax=Hymenobacter oligotrophus TaxID=2319843 RepID=A0A3B7RTZ0_9BACT|nr:T9SS type A sorting domain-containing protein [Hymenobacter oligotrophus]AYA37717.1 T9SS C-terminal target domain-containing protein [Hymenobacter oligotrophus]
MNKLYSLLLLAALAAGVGNARAQHTFSSVTTYNQNFDGLTGGFFISNATLPGVYIEYNGWQTLPTPANDGSTTTANFYHFGTTGSTDRALGGVASFTVSGSGYVGIRFRNNTGQTIRNLAVSFAVEQWYNSGRQDAAKVFFDYKTSATEITTPSGATGTNPGDWINVPTLNVDAPSTATVIENKNGNSDANRRTRTYTLQNVDVANGSEIALRWRYELNDATNGNGLSLDDVVVTPETSVFYYKGSGNLNELSSWAPNRDGSGNSPASFTASNQTYYVLSQVTTDRLGADWTVSGTNSRVVVGDGITPAALLVPDGNGNAINATVDVLDGATLEIQRANQGVPTLGRLANTSTVKYALDNNITLGAQAFGNLVISGRGTKTLAGSTVLNGNLELIGSPMVRLKEYDLTLIRGGKITGGNAEAYIRADEGGALRQTVEANGQFVEFPVGLNNSYNPVRIKQSAARSEDVFAVEVAPGLFPNYSGKTGQGANIEAGNVRRTWFISEENAGGSDATVQLEWTNAHAAAGFDPAQARLEHYSTARNSWDAGTPVTPAVAAGTTYTVTRSGITNFSPFGVSSRSGGVLPVELVAFRAERLGANVRCAWQTASEKNNRHFVVERSADGRQFVALGTVAGAGNSAVLRSYTYLDAAALPVLSYYRLRQVDADGTTAYSPIVAVEACKRCNEGVTVAAVPNPNNGQFELHANAAPSAPVQVSVYSVVGAKVQQVQWAAGAKQAPLDLGQQPDGVYLVRVALPTGVQTVRVLKQ